MKYDELDRKAKQLIASEYPYKAERQLWDTTLKNQYQTRKFFDNPQQIQEFKEKAAEDDISLVKRRDFVVGQEDNKAQTVSLIDVVLGDKGEEPYRAALEMAKNEFDPMFVIKDLYAVQATRLRKGIEYEDEVGLGNNPETEACMSNLISIVKVANDIQNGKKLDVKLEGSLSSMIMDMDISDTDLLEEDIIDINGESNDA